jgi:anti-anti-sigma factor
MMELATSQPELLVTTRRADGLQVVTLAGEADLATEHRLVPVLQAVVRDTDAVVIDLSGLRFCSVRAVETVAEIMASAAHRGVRVAVVGLSRVTTHVWLLTGLPVPERFATLTAAVGALSRGPATMVAPPLAEALQAEIRAGASARPNAHDGSSALGHSRHAVLVLDAVAQLAGMLFTEQSLPTTLQQVACTVLRAVPEARYAAVNAVDPSGRDSFAVTEGLGWLLDERAHRPGFGPCTEAAATGRTVVVNCATPTEDADDTYGEFSRRARAHGIRQALAVPLHAGPGCVGAIGLYFTDLPLSGSTVHHVHNLAARVAIVVANAITHAVATDAATHLAAAVQSRAVIDQAKGVLMATQHCSPEDAFALLAQRSQNTNRKIHEVAADVVSTSCPTRTRDGDRLEGAS